jgi:hypothetical protein
MATQLRPPADDYVMSDDELIALLRNEERSAMSWRDTTLADEQANAIDYYEAEPFGDEEEGRSQVVVPDVAEVVDYMQVSVLRTVCSGDRVVEFEPGDTDQIPEIPDAPKKPQGDPNDPAMAQQVQQYQQAKAAYDQQIAPFRDWETKRVQAAEDATEAVNYQFMRRQNGYKVLLDWLQSGLIEKVGIVKTACITERKKVKQTITIPEEGLAQLADEGIEVIAADDLGDGQFTVTISRETQTKKYVDYPLPSEEYLFSARTRDEDDAEYQAHRCRKTLSDLIAMGFERDIVESLPTEDSIVDLDQRAVERWNDEVVDSVHRPLAMRKVWLLEEYIRADRDGDGIAELIKVFRVHDVLLESEEVDEAPFVTWTPFPRAHRMVGNSLAEKVMDIQRVDSVLTRQALDGVYQTNSPRMGVNVEGVTDETYDDLLVVRPGAIVRYRGTGNKPEPLNEAFDISKSLGMLEHMSGQREQRTGITRLNQGLDEDTLNKTASGQAALQATGQQMEEFVARNFAEGMARLFAKKLRLMVENGNPIALKVDGSYRRVDPASWDSNMNVAVRVGLGSGRKEQRLIYRGQLASFQQEGLPLGLTNAKKIYNNAAAMVRDSGLGNPSDYWVDPDSDDYTPPEPQQDPAMAKAQADMQIAQQRAQFDAEQAQQAQQLAEAKAQAEIETQRMVAEAKLEAERQHGELKLQLERERYAAEADLARQKAEQEALLAQQKAEFEASLAQQESDRNYELARQQAERDHELARERAAGEHAVALRKAENPLPKNRPGGDLSK